MYRLRRLRAGMSMAGDLRRAGGARSVEGRHRAQPRAARNQGSVQSNAVQKGRSPDARAGGREQEKVGRRSEQLTVRPISCVRDASAVLKEAAAQRGQVDD